MALEFKELAEQNKELRMTNSLKTAVIRGGAQLRQSSAPASAPEAGASKPPRVIRKHATAPKRVVPGEDNQE